MTFLYILLYMRKLNKSEHFGKITRYAIILDYEQHLEEGTQQQRKRHMQRYRRCLSHFGGLP